MKREKLLADIQSLIETIHQSVEPADVLPPNYREQLKEYSREAAFLQDDDIAEALAAAADGGFQGLFEVEAILSDAVTTEPVPTGTGICVDLEPDRLALLSLSATDRQLVVDGIEREETAYFVRFERTTRNRQVIDWVESRFPVVAIYDRENDEWLSFLILVSGDEVISEALQEAPERPVVVHAVPFSELVVPTGDVGFSATVERVPVDVAARDIELLGLYAGEVLRTGDYSEPVGALVSIIERAFSVSLPEMLLGINRRLTACSDTSGARITVRAEHGPTRLSVGIASLAESIVAGAVCALAPCITDDPLLVVRIVTRDSGRDLVLAAENGTALPDGTARAGVIDILAEEAARIRTTINGGVDVFPGDEASVVIRLELGATPRLMSVARARSGESTVAIPAAPIERTFTLRAADVATDPYGANLVRSLGRLLRLVTVAGEAYRGPKPVGKTCVIYAGLVETVGIVVDDLVGHDLVVRNADDNRDVYLSSDGTRVPLVEVT